MCGHLSETANTLTQIVELKHGQLSNEEALIKSNNSVFSSRKIKF